MVALEFDDELASVLIPASEIEPDTLVEQSKPWNLRSLIRYVGHHPVRREDDIQQVNEHVLVPLVTEHRFQSRIGQDIDIPLHYSLPAFDWSAFYNTVSHNNKFKILDIVIVRACIRPDNTFTISQDCRIEFMSETVT